MLRQSFSCSCSGASRRKTVSKTQKIMSCGIEMLPQVEREKYIFALVTISCIKYILVMICYRSRFVIL